nr:uncharacterized protein LOC112210979 [Halyomorpha halys]
MNSIEDEVIQMDVFSKIQNRINELDDSDSLIDPKNRRPFMSTFLTCRDELAAAKKENVMVRRAAVKKLIENDYRTMEEALIRVGLGFIATHP